MFEKKRFPTMQDISSIRWKKLEEKIKANKGKLIVLVHPFYESADKQYTQVITKLLSRDDLAIVILEERQKVRELQKRFPEHLIVPTLYDTGIVLDKYTKGGTEFFCGGNRLFFEKIRKLGAKSLFIGGMNTWYHNGLEYYKKFIEIEKKRLLRKGWRIKAMPTEGCVGYNYRHAIASQLFESVKYMPHALAKEKPIIERIYPKRKKQERKKPVKRIRRK